MGGRVRVFVNERPLDLEEGVSVGEAIAAYDATLFDAARDGRALATDGVGRPVLLDARLPPGAILRVRVSARAGESTS